MAKFAKFRGPQNDGSVGTHFEKVPPKWVKFWHHLEHILGSKFGTFLEGQKLSPFGAHFLSRAPKWGPNLLQNVSHLRANFGHLGGSQNGSPIGDSFWPDPPKWTQIYPPNGLQIGVPRKPSISARNGCPDPKKCKFRTFFTFSAQTRPGPKSGKVLKSW